MLKNNPYTKAYLNVIDEDVNNKVNVRKYRSIAAIIGGKYIPEINTIDCKGYDVRFKNTWLTNGSFDFKLINTSNDWSNMFYNCDKLTHLPEGFTIPEGVTNCEEMFSRCSQLTRLPDNFTIPNSVTNCYKMFYRCESLTHLSDNFTIPNNVINCNCMFFYCQNLTHLPDNFTIPNSVTDCHGIFEGCKSLIHLPDNFHIPGDINYKKMFNGCDKLKYTDSESYIMMEI